MNRGDIVGSERIGQNTYPHTAVGRVQHLLGQQVSNRVLMIHIVLKIDGLLCLPGQQCPCSEGITATLQKENTRLAQIGGLERVTDGEHQRYEGFTAHEVDKPTWQ